MKNTTLDFEISCNRIYLTSFALKFTKDIDDANDLVQDTIVKALHYQSLYKEGTNLRGWLYTIMRNTFINNHRGLKKRMSVIDTSEELSSAQLSNSAARNLGESKFIQEDINKALQGLQFEYSMPFLRYFEGYKYQEIADELNIPIGTVKTRIFVARQYLKEKLKQYKGSYKISA